ncbi:hypothetical protein ACVWXU_004205 [Streptomyces sp. TE33382]
MRMLQEFGAALRATTRQHYRADLDRARRRPEDHRMTTAPAIELRTFTTLVPVRSDLLDVYADVRAPLLHLPNYAVTTFGERLDRHGMEPGFVTVLAYADDEPVGYAYGNTIERGDR